MDLEYEYPLDFDWSVEEICDVIAFYNCIEKAYEEGIEKQELMDGYRKFKAIVDSKSYEKQIGNQFEEASGYSIYRTMQEAKNNEFIKMNK